MNLSSVISQFDTVFFIMLAFFTLAFTLMGMMTLLNAFRLRNVQLTWKAGKLKGYPLFSSVFLLFNAGIIAAVWYQQLFTDIILLIAYSWAGVSWFVASYLMSKRYITDYGIVKNINDPSQTIAWNRINDFVEHTHEDGTTYSFFYITDKTQKPQCCKKSVRLQLDVPKRKQEAFKKMLSHKLGRRFNCYSSQTADLEQFKTND